MGDQEATRRYADLALSTWLDDLVRGRRVLWIGDADTDATEKLARSAQSVLVLAPNPPPKRESQRRAARVSALKPGPLSFRPGSFDVVVVPDVRAVSLHEGDRLGDLRDVVGAEGVVVCATPAENDDLSYEALYELLAERFGTVRMIGQAPFSAHAIVDLAATEGDYEVTFDGSAVGTEPSAERWVAVASESDLSLDAYCVVQVPSAEQEPRRTRRLPAAEPREDRVAEIESELRAQRGLMDAANEHAEALERTLTQRTIEVGRLRDELRAQEAALAELSAELREREAAASAPAPAPAEPEAGRDLAEDYDRLERALADRGAHAAELEREVERLGTLVRDLIEELRELREGRGAEPEGKDASEELESALERAMTAEAARAEAQFQIDELMGRLAQAGDPEELEALRRREAALSGTVRGLRSRLAESEEMRALAEGRLAVVELDVSEQRRRNLELERQLGELREHFELELVRARGEPSTPRDRDAGVRASEDHLSERVGELSGQLVACRDLVSAVTEERDHARAENLRLTAMVGSLEHRYLGTRAGYERRIAELEHDGRVAAAAEISALSLAAKELRGERDGLRARLADREAALASRTAAPAPNREEVAQLREELEGLRHERTELEARANEQAANSAARDALVTRLQMDLAQEEGHRADLAQRVARAEQENDRLRGALLDASQQVDEALANEDRKDRLLRDARSSRVALGEVRAVIAELSEKLGQPVEPLRREITAAGIEAPETLETARVAELERELEDQETLIRSLSAQVEDRDDRIRALERRLEGVAPPSDDGEAIRRELMELQERAARLSDELLHERKARRAAENEARSRTGTSEGEVRELHERLGQSDAELLLLRGENATSERRLESMREAASQARNTLEELLGAATANGDPATAERLGNLIRLLNRF